MTVYLIVLIAIGTGLLGFNAGCWYGANRAEIRTAELVHDLWRSTVLPGILRGDLPVEPYVNPLADFDPKNMKVRWDYE